MSGELGAENERAAGVNLDAEQEEGEPGGLGAGGT